MPGSSLPGPSWGKGTGGGGGGSAESLSACAASALPARGAEPVALRAGVTGDAPLLARAAASAAWRSFFLRLSSAPRLELSGRREEGGERLAGRLLWELAPPTLEEACLLERDREEERQEDEYGRGERLLDRPERLNKQARHKTRMSIKAKTFSVKCVCSSHRMSVLNSTNN